MSQQPLLPVVEEFIAEVDQIRSIFDTCRGSRTVDRYLFPYCPFEDGCLISLWDAWNRFLRSLVLTSVAGPALGLSGTVYTPLPPRNEPAALAHLHQSRRGKAYSLIDGEPKWFNTMHMADILNTLAAPNSTVIVSALGASSIALNPIVVNNPLDEIRECRNFVAHKSAGTLNRIRVYASGGFSTLSHHLRVKRYGVETFHEWGDCMAVIAETAAQ